MIKMTRNFGYITLGNVLKELNSEEIPITRLTFYRKEASGIYPTYYDGETKKQQRTSGGWRWYSPTQAEELKNLIRKDYGKSKQ